MIKLKLATEEDAEFVFELMQDKDCQNFIITKQKQIMLKNKKETAKLLCSKQKTKPILFYWNEQKRKNRNR